MAHIYMTFDFGSDEEKAQHARHKLDVWKQAFRLDKKLLYKFEREDTDEKEASSEPAPPKQTREEKAAKSSKAAKAKTKNADEKPKPNGNVKLHLRLAFSGHEKLTEQRWVDRIPGEDPFKASSPKTVGPSDPGFGAVEEKFAALS